ncbi:MAG TPA: alpha/beta hydrolase domain-containing protein [Ramlibacter sp.]|nr:alpha/beta hydrolase domain-containing protein [Ramlibacter sp.]
MRFVWAPLLGAAFLVAACGSTGGSSTPPGSMQRLEIVSTADAYGGATPAGAAGPYTVITAIAHGQLDPKHPDNAGIADLDKAPVDAKGMVSYSTDVVILRPKSASNARRILFYDVVNRGRKIAQTRFIGGGLPAGGAAPDANFPSLLRAGYTVVWSGWQGNLPVTGAGATSALLGTSFPAAKNSDGTSITGLVREEYVPDVTAGGVIPLNYPPASLSDRSETSLTARQSWINAAGKMDYAAPSVPVTSWTYVTNPNGSVSVQFTPPASVATASGGSVAADAGTIYSFVYRARDPQVWGIGFAAVRDLVSFLKNEAADATGTANPLADMKSAVCASGANCPASPATNFDVVIAEGLSQSGRFLRDFLYQGFNQDAKGAKLFDGMMALIPAGRRIWLNERFAQPDRWSRQHEDHWMHGDQFPFAYNVMTDPVSGANDGLLKRCLANNTCPKIMQIDGSYEWWGGRASLVVTDGAGHDLTLPDNVRYYLIAGTQHSGGAGVTTGVVTQPAAGSTCQFAASPVSMPPAERALITAMENWLVKGTPPPASRYPTVASGQAVPPTAGAMGFPNLAAVTVPNGASGATVTLSVSGVGLVNQLFVTDYSNPVPVANLNRQYALFVPKVDANGNESSGILVPEVAAPLATYAAWNPRGTGHAAGENCIFTGSTIPFAIDASTKAATDPRSALSQLYSGRADYWAKFDAAADALVASGLLGTVDATNYKNGARSVSTVLIPAP